MNKKLQNSVSKMLKILSGDTEIDVDMHKKQCQKIIVDLIANEPDPELQKKLLDALKDMR